MRCLSIFHFKEDVMFSEWLETVAMIVKCQYGEDLNRWIEEGRVKNIRRLYEGGLDEHQAADAIADVCWF